MKKEKLYKDRDWLEEQYVEKGKSMREIGEIFDITDDAIGRWIKKFDIPTRNRSDYIKGGKFQDKNWLEEKYIEEGLSTRAIAELEDCSNSTIRKYLHKFDISVRNIGQAPDKKLYKNKQWLERKFREENLDIHRIARQADCSSSTIHKYLHKLDILEPARGWKRITCDYCDKAFQRKKSEIRDSHNFCSAKCAEEFQKTDKQTVKCSQCEKEIERWPYQIENNKLFFCSKECQGKWNSENQSGKNHPNYAKKIIVTCAECGAKIKVYPYRVENTDNFLCSKACEKKWKSRNFSGSDNSSWKANATRPYYRGPNWQEQRRKVLERDDNTCQVCGITQKELGKELSVHHIVPFSRFRYPLFQGNPVKNVLAEFDWERANKTKNLISLCPSCHNRVEGNENFFN